jgi:DNA-binding CsgD family transcriptional regulator/N-acetylneuraminic acid mutarotase
MQHNKVELSERELEIMRLVATGASNKEIARQLFISTNTVKVHLRNIFQKTGVNSRTEAAMYAVKNGIVQPSSSDNEMEDVEKQTGGQNNKKSYLIWGSVIILISLIALLTGLYYYQTYSKTKINPGATLDTERWKTAAAMAVSRFGLAAVTYENNIYAIAGGTTNGITDILERYNPDTNAWVQLAPKKTPVYEVSAGVINGNFYVPGGRLKSDQVSNILEVYNPLTDTWSVGESLPQPLCAYGLAVFEGRLYLFGGWNGKEFVDNVYVYYPSEQKWIEKTPLDFQRGYLNASTVGERIFVVGGNNGKQFVDNTDVYSPVLDDGSRNAWSQAAGIPTGRARMGMAAISSYLQIIGGVSENNEPSPALLYNVQSDQWSTFEPVNKELWTDLTVVSLGSRIYILGGKLDGKPTNKVLSYQAIYTIAAPIINK